MGFPARNRGGFADQPEESSAVCDKSMKTHDTKKAPRACDRPAAPGSAVAALGQRPR